MNAYYYFLFIAAVACSCTQSREERSIIEYEQTVGGTKTDLSIKIKSLTKSGSLTAGDSAKALAKILDEQAVLSITKSKEKFIEYHNKIREQIDILTMTRSKARSEQAQKTIDMYLNFMRVDSIRSAHLEQKDFINTPLHDIYRKMKRFESNPDSIIASKFDCRYSIKNPALNFANQEIHKIYFITSDGKISNVLEGDEEDLGH